MESTVILVGHGGVPTDCPPELVVQAKRHSAEADKKLRSWPRTPLTDPYKTGLEGVAASLRQALGGREVLTAYNEFCAPSLEDALADAVGRGAKSVTVISTMFTRGGVHSEKEIPELLSIFRKNHPGVDARYCWPFDLKAVGALLAGEVARAEAGVAR